MKSFLASFLIIVLNSTTYSQSDSDILFQYSGETITIRKTGENNPMWYSETSDKILFLKEEMVNNTDSLYLIKPKVTVFSAKMFESDAKPQINIRIDYFYQKRTNGKIEVKQIERWSKSYYPSIQKVESMQDTRSSNNRVSYIMNDKSQWIVETDKDGSRTLFYVRNESSEFLNFALMLPNCKTLMVNGNSYDKNGNSQN